MQAASFFRFDRGAVGAQQARERVTNMRAAHGAAEHFASAVSSLETAVDIGQPAMISADALHAIQAYETLAGMASVADVDVRTHQAFGGTRSALAGVAQLPNAELESPRILELKRVVRRGAR